MRFLSSNSSQTFQSFKISLIFLQDSFKIRMTPFSYLISCCFTLQIWKGNGRTGNWSHICPQEWISSSFHQHLYNLSLIVIWWINERSYSILKMKSNLTIDDKRWNKINKIWDNLFGKKDEMVADMRDWRWWNDQPSLKFLIYSSNHQFLTSSAISTSAPCWIKIRDISGWS